MLDSRTHTRKDGTTFKRQHVFRGVDPEWDCFSNVCRQVRPAAVRISVAPRALPRLPAPSLRPPETPRTHPHTHCRRPPQNAAYAGAYDHEVKPREARIGSEHLEGTAYQAGTLTR